MHTVYQVLLEEIIINNCRSHTDNPSTNIPYMHTA